MSRLRIIALGTTESLVDCLHAWAEHHDVVGGLSMPVAARPDNSFDLAGWAAQKQISYAEFEDINAEPAQRWLAALQPDVIYSMWPRLLAKNIIALPRIACIGTHCTRLPANRGRHPLHWMIAQGITESAISFFRIEEGVDSGEIFLQVPFRLESHETIREALLAMNKAAREGCRTLSARLAREARLQGRIQNDGDANYWRKRTLFDTIIDFRMSAHTIDRLIRSYCSPFPCAKLLWRDWLIAIERGEIISPDAAEKMAPAWRRFEPGRIVGQNEQGITVKADDLLIRLMARDGAAALAGLPTQGCILPPMAYVDADRKLAVLMSASKN